MSDNILRIIPTDPAYLPDAATQTLGYALFSSFVAKADKIQALVLDEIQFIDPGENFVSVTCPVCGADLGDWWQGVMDNAYQNHFENLTITTPCCESTGSLNDLVYEGPAGFARYILEAKNPVNDVSEAQLNMLGNILKCGLRKITARI
ncbi:MAG TPA: hypothetical protein VKQ72_01975 [Aggregatilineales bacterium]|nr:hypothetical protein [Aggregatilineales bacterium]